jgi:hypothetical protein
MTDAYHEILKYLFENGGVNKEVSLYGFLKELMGDQANDTGSLMELRNTIGRLQGRKYIAAYYIPIFGTRGNGFDHNTLDDHPNFSLRLTQDGHDYIANSLKQSKELNLLERQTLSIEATNDLSRNVFASTIRLNNEIIPNFNSTQRALGILTLIVAAISLISISLSTYYASKGVTSGDIDSLKLKIQYNTTILDSMRQFQKGIDASLQKAVRDSFYQKHH